MRVCNDINSSSNSSFVHYFEVLDYVPIFLEFFISSALSHFLFGSHKLFNPFSQKLPHFGSIAMSSNSRDGLMDILVQQDHHSTDKDSSPLSDDYLRCFGDDTADDFSMLLEGTKDSLLPFPQFTQAEDFEDVSEATKDRTNSPPVTIGHIPVIVTPSRATVGYIASIMDSITNNNALKDIQHPFTSAFQTYFPQTGPTRVSCLESSTSIGWFPNGTYVDGPFDPATYSFGDGLDWPSAVCQDETNADLGSIFPAVSFDDADATDEYTQDMEFSYPRDLSMPDAMDISVTSFESHEELDSKPPAMPTAMRSDTSSLEMYNVPSSSVSPLDSGGKIISNMTDHLHKQESSSSMSSSAHESFASAHSSAYMSANEDGDSLVSTKRRIRWRDPENKEYDTPREGDVLLGRGGKSNHHPGNKVYRRRVLNKQRIYQALPTREKKPFSRAIVDWVHQECNGRFMMKDEYGWFEVTLEKALLKVSQALREDHSAEGKKRKKDKQKIKQMGGKNKKKRRTK
jgi:hypothetical protein